MNGKAWFFRVTDSPQSFFVVEYRGQPSIQKTLHDTDAQGLFQWLLKYDGKQNCTFDSSIDFHENGWTGRATIGWLKG